MVCCTLSQLSVGSEAQRLQLAMADEGANFPPIDETLSSNPNAAIFEGSCGNSEELIVDGSNGFGNNEDCHQFFGENGNDLSGGECGGGMVEIGSDDFGNVNNQQVTQSGGRDYGGVEEDMIVIEQDGGGSHGRDYPIPVVGMEFESYEDVYNYYNCYAKELGFAIRVKSSWTKRNSKEKRGAVLCCNCEGFKTVKEANTRRKETRTGCQAMIRLRLVDCNRWRVDEVKLEHNHSFDPERALNSKSHKKTEVGSKRKVEQSFGVEVRTINLYPTPVVDLDCGGNVLSNDGEVNTFFQHAKCSKLKERDAQTICGYFSRAQLTNPNFIQLMDLNDEGNLRNVFWIDSRSRAANAYFGDVIFLDTSCLSNKYEVPLVIFVGVNHHGQSVLLGSALLGDDTEDSYNWLLRTWLTCMSGRPPQTIITDYDKALKTTIAEVFPRARHHLSLSDVMQKILESMVEHEEFEAFQMLLSNIVHNILKVDDFEISWGNMVQRFGLGDNQLLHVLYLNREQWAPAYSKDSFFAGMYAIKQGDPVTAYFDGFVQKNVSLKELVDVYDEFVLRQRKKETLDDLESREWSARLRTRCYYESQLSTIYTKETFEKFQHEVEMMSACFNIAQVHASGTSVTFKVKERVGEGQLMNIREFDVMYDKTGAEVRCICSGFNFKGYLCRHALCILNLNGAQEIPCLYVLSRWRKDIRRLYSLNVGSNGIDIANPVQRFEQLHKQAVLISEEGMRSQDHYQIAWQALKESLDKVCHLAGKQ